MQGTHKRPEGATGAEAEANAQLLDIQRELEALKQRRTVLEEQRKMLLSGCNSTAASTSPVQCTLLSHGAPSDAVGRTRPQLTRSSSARQFSHSSINHSRRIPSEAERQKLLKKNVFREMKDSMRRSLERDSSLAMGTFLLEDNPHAGTFGRERRFIPIANGKGTYHLSTDFELMQRQKNAFMNNVTASLRGRGGMNISGHWNDLQCSGPPGPGAYTPRYGKLAKPSILTRR
ncbi:uncharacterized protein Tco025E_00531 [Trypanosoma conorhini]|uniref:Uncharacterized protein n=1 Tax=Trypanosoma conorhini TaxID=83891 RepID=A0A3R7P182_9TRYP|nr:uncharacterized protein Tco025E_00531 [Trypanosoma conorhini]RNF27224.1 hypothetical protein Tco025E_00531 [Trypanosoma conorhini]